MQQQSCAQFTPRSRYQDVNWASFTQVTHKSREVFYMPPCSRTRNYAARMSRAKLLLNCHTAHASPAYAATLPRTVCNVIRALNADQNNLYGKSALDRGQTDRFTMLTRAGGT